MIKHLDEFIGNIPLCVFCIVLLVFVVLLNVKHLFNARTPDRVGTGLVVLWLVFTFYSCFNCPPYDDNYMSMDNYYQYISGIDRDSLHFEPIYFWLMDIFSFGYVSWRFAVWGLLGATSYVIVSKLLRLDKHLSTIFCFTFALPILFFYQRATCGYCLLYIAMAIYLENPLGYKKHTKMFIAILAALASLLFHTAMPFYLTILIISIFTPLNKGSILVIIGAAVLVNFSLLSYTESFLRFMSEDTQETGIRYIENARVMHQNLAGLIFEYANRAPVYFMVLYGIIQQLRGKIQLSKAEKACLINTFILLLVSFMFKEVSNVIEIKFYKASMAPFTLFMASYFPKIRGTRIANLLVIVTALILALITIYKISRGVFFYSI